MSMLGSITVRVPLTVRQRPGRKTFVMPECATAAKDICDRADPAIVKALARAHRWRRMLEDERYSSISEMAAGERIERGYLGSILRLTLLAPDFVEAILNGRQPEMVTLPKLMKPFPATWAEQSPAFNHRHHSLNGTHDEPHHLHAR